MTSLTARLYAKHPTYLLAEAEGRWGLIASLLGGTQAMQARASEYLPKFSAEDTEDWTARVNGAVLYAGFEDAIDTLTSLPFSEKVGLPENTPPRLKLISNDADYEEQDLTSYADEVMRYSIAFGVSYILVDSPAVAPGTVADAEESGIHPYFIHVKAQELVDWEIEKDPKSGRKILSKIKIHTIDTQSIDGVAQAVDKITIWTRTEYEVYTRKQGESSDEGWSRTAGENRLGYIPLVPYYTNKVAFMRAKPPMLKVAELNLTHFQSNADQRAIIHVARVPFLFARGLSEEQAEGNKTGQSPAIVIGPYKIVKATRGDADLKFVEHSGRSIGAGERDLQRLEQQMHYLGLVPMLDGPSYRSAREVDVGDQRDMSNLRSWVRGLRSALNRAFKIAADWAGVKLPADFSVTIYENFGIPLRSQEDVNVILQLLEKKNLQLSTALKELKRRRFLSDDVKESEEVAASEKAAKEAAERIPQQPGPGNQQVGNNGVQGEAQQ